MGNDFVVKKVFRSFLLVSILTVFAATLGMMIDGIVIGNFMGRQEFTAFGVSSPVFLILVAVGNIFSSGGSNLCAVYIGKGDVNRLKNVFTITIISTMVFSLLLMLVGYATLEQFARILGATEKLMQPTMDYLKGIYAGTLPIMLSAVLMAVTRIDGSKNLALYATLAMTIVNVILDMMVVYVINAGMFGMAIAKSISFMVCVITTCIHFLKKDNSLQFIKIFDVRHELLHLIKIGFPSALIRVCNNLRTVVLNNMLVIWAGSAAVTALTVRSNVYNIVGALTIGVAQAILPVAGIFYGENDKKSLGAALKDTILVGLIVNGIAFIGVFALSAQFVSIFGVNEPAETVAMCKDAVRYFSISMPFMVINLILLNFFQSTHNSRMANTICVCEGALFVILFSFGLFPAMSMTGVWLAFVLAEIVMLMAIFIIAACKLHRLPKSIDDLMLLPPEYGSGESMRFAASVGNSMEEVMALSERVAADYNDTAENKKTAAIISLCIEELGGNIVRHAFVSGQKDSIDICTYKKEDKIIFRIRYYGQQFNPVAYLSSIDKDDITKNIGLSLVQGLVKDISYRYSLGINNLLLTLDEPRGELRSHMENMR